MRDCKIKPSNDLSLTEHIIQKYLTQGLESRYNDRRSHVLTLFPSFDCHQIRHPASDEEPHLTPIYELNHNFNAEIKKAIELLCSSISCKRCLQSDEPLTSEIFVRLAKQYIQALNTNTGITDINLNWDTVCQNRLDSLSEELVLEYQNQMEAIQFPVEEGDISKPDTVTLLGMHSCILHEIQSKLDKECNYLLPDDETLHFEKKEVLEEKIKTVMERLKSENYNDSKDHCLDVFNDVFKSQASLNLKELKSSYMAKAIGPAKYEVYEKETSDIPGPLVIKISERGEKKEKAVILEWDKPEINPDAAEKFEIQIKGKDNFTWKNDNVHSPLVITSTKIKELSPNQTYHIRLRGYNTSKRRVGEFSKRYRIIVPCGVPDKPFRPNTQVCGDDPTKLALFVRKLPKLKENGETVNKVIIQKQCNKKQWITIKEENIEEASANPLQYSVALDNYTMENTCTKFRVIMRNNVGESEPSQSERVDLTKIVPGPPVNLKSFNVTCESIELSWEKPDINPLAVDMYKVECRNNEWKRALYTRECSKVIDKLSPHTKYAFQVKSLNQNDDGINSSLDVETLLAKPTKPRKPLLHVEKESIYIHIDLNKNEESKKLVIAKYNVKEEQLDQNIIELPEPLKNDRTECIKLPFEDKIHFISIQAENDVGISESSDLVPVNPSFDTKPGTVRNLRPRNIFENTVKLAWDAPDERERAVFGYRIQMKLTSENKKTWRQLAQFMDRNELTTEIKRLKFGTEYDFRVYALNRDSEGDYSDELTVTTGCRKPAKPSRPSIQFEAKSKEFILSIKPISPKDEYGSSVTDVKIEYYHEKEWKKCSLYKLNTSLKYPIPHSIASLSENINIRVRLKNGVGESEPSEMCSLHHNEARPDPVANLAVNNTTSSSVELSWTKPKKLPDVLTAYKIELDEDDQSNDFTDSELFKFNQETNCKLTDNGQKIHCKIIGLDQKTTYVFSICTLGEFKDSEEEKIQATTAEKFPGPPVKLVIDKMRSDAIKIRWNHPHEQDGLEYYEVKCIHNRTGQLVKEEIVKATSTYSQKTVIDGLESNTSYDFHVAAKNKFYNGRKTSVGILKDKCTKFSDITRVALTVFASLPTLGVGGIIMYHATKPASET